MRAINLLRIGIALILVLSTAGPVATVAGTKASPDRIGPVDAADVCQQVDVPGRTIVGILPGPENTPLINRTVLYPGSQLHLGLCRNNRPIEGWSLADNPGFRELSSTETAARVEITGQEYPVRFGQFLKDRSDVDGIVVNGTGSTTYSPRTVDNGQIKFGSSEQMETFATADQSFAVAASELKANLSELDRMSGQLEEGKPFTGERERRIRQQILPAITKNTQRMHESGMTLRTRAFNLIVERRSPKVATKVIQRSEQQERRLESHTETRLRGYLNVLDDQAAGAKNDILTDLILSLLVGLIIGGGLGTLFPYYRAKQFKGRARLTSQDEYGRQAAMIPALSGLIIIVLTLILISLRDGVSVLEVII
jgi:hypothetical protein